MLTLDQYMTEWATDAVIPKDALDEASRQIPYLHGKWWKYLLAAKLHLKKIELEYKILYRNKVEWYTDKMLDEDRLKLKWPARDGRKILPAQLAMYIDADTDVQELMRRKTLADETANFLIDVIKHVNGRGFIISNMVKFLAFSQGS
jgi:hypothetical protein